MKFILYSCGGLTVLQNSFIRHEELLAGSHTEVYLLSNVTSFDSNQVSDALKINTPSTIYLIPESLGEPFVRELKQLVTQKSDDFLTKSAEILWKSYEADSLPEGQAQVLREYIFANMSNLQKDGKLATEIIFSDILEVLKKTKHNGNARQAPGGSSQITRVKTFFCIMLFIVLLGVIGRQNWPSNLHAWLTEAKKNLTKASEICQKNSLSQEEAKICEKTHQVLTTLNAIEVQTPKCSSTCVPQGEAKEISPDKLKVGVEGPALVEIPTGCFCPAGSTKQIQLKPFAVSKYKITFAEYDRFCEATGKDRPGRDKRAVIEVSWLEAVEYTRWLSEQTGQIYRLPTEAEWEYAARAGNRDDAIPGTMTYQMGPFITNSFGIIYETANNEREFTCSRSEELQTCVDNFGDGIPITVRGGAFKCAQEEVRVTSNTMAPSEKNDFTGFRVVKEINTASFKRNSL